MENWVTKQNETIKDLDKKLEQLDENGIVIKESLEVDNLKKKVIGIELEVSGLKRTRQEHLSNTVSVISPKSRMKKCELCDKRFSKNVEFENHMVEKHDTQKPFECSICDKKFILEWRLKKHGLIHTQETQKCRYFSSNQFCPFDSVGCMFAHSNQTESVESSESDEDEQNEMCNENQCHLCREQLLTRDYSWDHVEANHQEYYQGMLEFSAAAKR